MRRAVELRRAGDEAAEQEVLARLVAKDVPLAYYYERLALLLQAAGRHEEAVSICDRWLNRRPRGPKRRALQRRRWRNLPASGQL